MTVAHNPYADVSWDTVDQHVGNTHAHADTQEKFEAYYTLGIRVFSLSNYYPSQPTCPLSDFFDTTGRTDTVCLPNSEVHGFSVYPNLHINSLGSTFVSVDKIDLAWPAGFDAILADLVWPDAGGLIIAHPMWSRITADVICAMLDHDPRVLGIEALNALTENNDYPPPRDASAIPLWDEILTTGRQCFGFFVTDHKNTAGNPGRSILLLEEFTGEAAARAYRNGHFFGARFGAGLTVQSVTVEDRAAEIVTDSADTITMVTNLGRSPKSGTTAEFTVPDDAVYVRFEAENTSDTVYTQPVVYEVPIIPPPVDQAARRRRMHRYIAMH